ncbi:MAG: hypothetical protein ABSE44_03945 [Candidatus Sulfotelmatobacter sp.]|jgi:hypothetical protein
MKRSLKFWLAGFAVGGVLYCFWHLHNSGKIPSLSTGPLLFFEDFTYVLWPSSIILMSLSGQHPLNTLAIVSITLSINGFIYMGVGYVLSKIFRAGDRSAGTPPGPRAR